MSNKEFDLECNENNAERFMEWVLHRGGVAVWRSINLSNIGKSWSTPALTDGKPTGKPCWEANEAPEMTITDVEKIGVYSPKIVKQFHVGTRRGGQGLSIKVTDAGSRRIFEEIRKANEKYNTASAYYEFDYMDYDNCAIVITDHLCSLKEWENENKQKAGGEGIQEDHISTDKAAGE